MNIWGKDVAQLQEIVVRLGYPKYRGKQLSDYLYRRGVLSFSAMQQLPLSLRSKLQEFYKIEFPQIVRKNISTDKQTSKILLRFADQSLVESVLMKHPYGYSACISTQVGCAVGCQFCASGKSGLIRNLTAFEMLAQIFSFQYLLGISIHSLVLMGSGEPLQNYKEVIDFLRLVNNPNVLGISYRNITLSTSGIIPKIYELAKENMPITLAISLHAPNDAIRNQIMPISKLYPLESLLAALRSYTKETKRRITCEYILLKNINDQIAHAKELVLILKGLSCHVNLIPMNEVPGIMMNRPDEKTISSFSSYLNEYGVNATIRKEMGKEIDAACGQLKLRHLSEVK